MNNDLQCFFIKKVDGKVKTIIFDSITALDNFIGYLFDYAKFSTDIRKMGDEDIVECAKDYIAAIMSYLFVCAPPDELNDGVLRTFVAETVVNGDDPVDLVFRDFENDVKNGSSYITTQLDKEFANNAIYLQQTFMMLLPETKYCVLGECLRMLCKLESKIQKEI